MDWVIMIGVCLLLYLGLAWHHDYAWRRDARRFRREHHADRVKFNLSCPALATPVPPIEPDDGRDALRAVVDAPRVLWSVARRLFPAGPGRYRPSPRCDDCGVCIVDPGKCWTCHKRSVDA